MNKLLLLLLVLIALSSACIRQTDTKQAVKNDSLFNNSDYLLQSVLWYQRSGEMKALYIQSYNIARASLDNYLAHSKSRKKKAVIVDIDETILNNSPFEGKLIQYKDNYASSPWNEWISKSIADTLPGALAFLNYAAGKKTEIFYISNRSIDGKEVTLRNLWKFSFPYADEKHLLLKSDTNNSKELRRRQVGRDYDIALLCGDNLADFDEAFDNREEQPLNNSIEKYKLSFGSRFVILPNPMYGDWERQIYDSHNASATQKDSIRKTRLIAY
jgi:5'-nucleotidase (lipoprotein e(P4) family)